MAEDFESRTEPATPRRREEARKQGQVAYSTELVSAMVLLAGVALLAVLGPRVGRELADTLRIDFTTPCPRDLGSEEARELLSREFGAWLRLVGVFVGVLVFAGVVANVVQVGFYLAPEKLGIDFARLSPVEGMQRLFSLAALVRGGLAVLKVSTLAVLAWMLLRDRAGLVLGLSWHPVSEIAAQSWGLTLRLAMGIAGALAVLGVLDYLYQRYRFEQGLRMTKQEVKEEVKREEGDPQIKARVRRVQRDMARRRMLAAVKKAAVVLTNPTHIAIALQYERGVNTAPRLVAKGAGFVAEHIKAEARRYGVPVVERPTLARALYGAVKLDQDIPPVLFQAVAEVLAYLYRLRSAA